MKLFLISEPQSMSEKAIHNSVHISDSEAVILERSSTNTYERSIICSKKQAKQLIWSGPETLSYERSNMLHNERTIIDFMSDPEHLTKKRFTLVPYKRSKAEI